MDDQLTWIDNVQEEIYMSYNNPHHLSHRKSSHQYAENNQYPREIERLNKEENIDIETEEENKIVYQPYKRMLF